LVKSSEERDFLKYLTADEFNKIQLHTRVGNGQFFISRLNEYKSRTTRAKRLYLLRAYEIAAVEQKIGDYLSSGRYREFAYVAWIVSASYVAAGNLDSARKWRDKAKEIQGDPPLSIQAPILNLLNIIDKMQSLPDTYQCIRKEFPDKIKSVVAFSQKIRVIAEVIKDIDYCNELLDSFTQEQKIVLYLDAEGTGLKDTAEKLYGQRSEYFNLLIDVLTSRSNRYYRQDFSNLEIWHKPFKWLNHGTREELGYAAWILFASYVAEGKLDAATPLCIPKPILTAIDQIRDLPETYRHIQNAFSNEIKCKETLDEKIKVIKKSINLLNCMFP
jgi:hypothetical protein